MINLTVEPRIAISWKQFLADSPPYSIALDGYVMGKPRVDIDGPKANFNHHEDVDRLGTRSTCGQVFVAIKQGLFDTFREDDEPTANVFVNDCDQDTCMAVWLLRNSDRVARVNAGASLRNLVVLTDLLDTTAGAYPLPTSDLSELAWMFQPYTEVRHELTSLRALEMTKVIDAVGERIDAYLRGAASVLEVDTSYEVLGGGPDWILVREIGPFARSRLFEEGVKAYVLISEEDDRLTYAIGKMSPYADFPILELYDLLNRAEGLDPHSGNAWGGSDIIGGSPRLSGSRLKPHDVERLINQKLRLPG